MKRYSISDLDAISTFLQVIPAEDYSVKLEILSGATIGQHVRHIVEFYDAVINGLDLGIVCYDDRKRDLRLEDDKLFSERYISNMIKQLEAIEHDSAVILRTNYGEKTDAPINIRSSLYRELGYCIEHSIHHQALIKIGARYLHPKLPLNESFGVAPATIRYRKEQVCAQ